MFCARLSENFCFFEMHEYSKNDQFLGEKSKVQRLHEYCPAAIGMAFSTKFLLDAKVRNSGFRHISTLGSC